VRCELCGEEIRGRAYLGVVDRAEMILCEKCVKRASRVYGPLGQAATPRRPVQRARPPGRLEEAVSEEVVEDYARIIREARERAGLTRDALAAMLGVKVSVIRRIEEGALTPPIDLARKIERVLKVKLVEEVIDERLGRRGEAEAWEETLGDVAVFKE
jgi:putative transcription factor